MAIVGNVLSLMQTDSGTVVAGTGGNNGRLYYSNDNGLTWTAGAALGDATTRVNALVKDRNGNLFAATSHSTNPFFNGIWKGTDPSGGLWSKVKSHPIAAAGAGYLDITAIQGFRLVAVGTGITDVHTMSPIILSNDAGATWVNVPQVHFGHTFNAVASSPETVLGTIYPGDTVGVNPAFYGSVHPYTAVGRAGLTGFQAGGLPIAASYNMVVDPMGQEGLDMAAFLVIDSGNNFRHRALWAVTALSNPANTEVWSFPATPTGPYKFVLVATIAGERFNVMYPEPSTTPNVSQGYVIGTQRTVWAGATGKIFVSFNSGLTWTLATDAPVNNVRSFVRTRDNVMIAGGDNGEIYRFTGTGSIGGGGGGTGPTDPPPVDPPPTPPVIDETPPTTAFLGRTETTDNAVYVGNKMAFSNVTHVLHYNGSTYENLQFTQNPPYNFLGATLAVGKMAYFGSQTNNPEVPGGTFGSLVFNIDQVLQNATLVWEYWNGSAWVALTVYDNSDSFKLAGARSVHWHPPATWATTAVSTITGYWVRVRVSALAASPQAPIQDERFIYTILLPYVEIAENIVGGDLPAAARVQWHNRADDIQSSIAMEADRVVCGLRTVSRGPQFQSYLNISDVQAPFGITVTAGDGSTWTTVKLAPTTRALVVSYSTLPQLYVWKDMATFTLTNTIARDFYGSYRVFVRCFKSNGSQNTWQLRIHTSFGSGGNSVDSQVVTPYQFADWHVLDFGQISIPTTQVSQQAGNLGDQLTISVQGKCADFANSITLYDLILVPVDEWAIDSKPPKVAATMTSQIRHTNFLDIDSITNPKSMLNVFNRNAANQIVGRYQALNNGPAMLQAGRQQRLWFLTMATTGSYWYAYPSLAGTVMLFKQQRYLGLRGKS